MESQTSEVRPGEVMAGIERMEARLEAAASLVERAVALLEEREGEVRRLVAATGAPGDPDRRGGAAPSRETELEQKLQTAEQQIAELKAQLESRPESQPEAPASARRTVPAATAQFLAKQGLALEQIEAGALDAALSSLSLEQRIAVKAQLLRAGLTS